MFMFDRCCQDTHAEIEKRSTYTGNVMCEQYLFGLIEELISSTSSDVH